MCEPLKFAILATSHNVGVTITKSLTSVVSAQPNLYSHISIDQINIYAQQFAIDYFLKYDALLVDTVCSYFENTKQQDHISDLLIQFINYNHNRQKGGGR